MTTGRKLMLGGVVVATVTAYLAYAGASSSWQYYLTADECVSRAPELVGSRLRINGKVAADSLEVDASKRRAVFRLVSDQGDLEVICECLLPDNLAEGMDVVVEGYLERPDLVRGHKVLTKCASKYGSQGSS